MEGKKQCFKCRLKEHVRDQFGKKKETEKTAPASAILHNRKKTFVGRYTKIKPEGLDLT